MYLQISLSSRKVHFLFKHYKNFNALDVEINDAKLRFYWRRMSLENLSSVSIIPNYMLKIFYCAYPIYYFSLTYVKFYDSIAV